MADETAGTGAQSEGTKETPEEQDPFAGFDTEGFNEGERGTQEKKEPPVEEKKKEPPAEEKKAGAPGSAAKDGEQQDDQHTADDGVKPAAKKKPTAEERIGELTGKWRAEERLREAAEQRVRELEARGGDDAATAAAETAPGKKAVAAKGDAAGKTPAKDDGAPKPEDFPFGELDSGYIVALAEHAADKRFNERVAAREQEDEEKRFEDKKRADQEKFSTRIDSAKEKYDDFEDKVIGGAERGDWALSAELGALIAESDAGPDIAYHLAANPDEAALVYRQSPLEQARYFGRMEAKFSAEQAAADGKEPAKLKVPKTPAPIEQTRGRGGQFQVSADTDDFAAFERVAMEKL